MVKMLSHDDAMRWAAYMDDRSEAIGVTPPIIVSSPEQAAALYGPSFGESVRDAMDNSRPVVFVRVSVTGPPSR